ncbi:MAG TPA: hypothetical protein PK224_19070 [Nitrospira sp.]|nr:hypothetical protein [Nitrospira sp.]
MVHFVLILVQLFVAIEYAAAGGSKFACSPDPKEPNTGIFSFTGKIEYEDGPPFQRELKSCLDKQGKIGRIDLDSTGGSVKAAFIMAEEISKYGFRTHVPAGSRCVSACTLVFLGGRRRTKDLDGTYEVHAYSAYKYDGNSGFTYTGIPDNASVLLTLELLHTLSAQMKSGQTASLLTRIPVPETTQEGWAWPKGERDKYAQVLNSPEIQKLVSALADQLSTNITKIERNTQKTVLEYYRFVQKQRVSSKFLDHMFDPTIKSLQVMSDKELSDFAVITEPARSYASE